MSKEAVKIKIFFEKANQEREFYFSPQELVSEVLAVIKEKIKADIGGPTYGFFIPTTSDWMRLNSPIGEYDNKLKGVTVQFKNQEKNIKIQLIDNSIRTISVLFGDVIGEVIKTINSKIELSHPEEYGLILFDPQKKKTEIKDKRNGIEKLVGILPPIVFERGKDKEKAELWGREKDKEVFMDPRKTLTHYDVKENDTIILRKKFRFNDHHITVADKLSLKLTFLEAVHDLVSSRYCVSDEQAGNLSAYILFFVFGEYNEKLIKTIDLGDFLPIEYANDKKAKKVLIEKYMNISKKKFSSLEQIMVSFLQETRNVKDYGSKYFQVLEKVPKGKDYDLVTLAFGLSRNYLTVSNPKTKKIQKQWELKWVRRWITSERSKVFSVDFGDHADSYLNVITKEISALSEYLGGYINLSLKKKKTDGLFWQYPAENTEFQESDFIIEEFEEPEAMMVSVSSVNVPALNTVMEFSTASIIRTNEILSGITQPKSTTESYSIKISSASGPEASEIDYELLQTLASFETLREEHIAMSSIRKEPYVFACQNIFSSLTELSNVVIDLVCDFSGLKGGISAYKVRENTEIISKYATELDSACKIASRYNEESKPIYRHCRSYIDTLKSILECLRNDSTKTVVLLDKLELLGNACNPLIQTLEVSKTTIEDQEELLWRVKTIETSCNSLIFPLLDRGMTPLLSRPLDLQPLTNAAAKLFLALKLFSFTILNLSPLSFSPKSKEVMKSTLDTFNYMVDILETTCKKVIDDDIMKNLYFSLSNVREELTKLSSLISSIQEIQTMDKKPNDDPKELVRDVLDTLNIMLNIIDLENKSFGDPSDLISSSQTISEKQTIILGDIKPRKSGAIWEQVIKECDENLQKLSESIHNYSLAVFRMDDETSENEASKMFDAASNLISNYEEIDGMWDI